MTKNISMTSIDNIYKMELHDFIVLDDGDAFFCTHILRVSGGYIYTIFDKGNSISSSTFMPFDNESQLRSK